MNSEEVEEYYKSIIEEIPKSVRNNYHSTFDKIKTLVDSLNTDRKLYSRRWEMCRNELEHLKNKK